MTHTSLLLIAPLLLLSACAAVPASTPAAPSQPAPSRGECNAANAQFAVGRTYDAQLRAEAQQRSGAMAVRVYKTGDPITMDYSTQRLNLELDAAGKVVKASCG
jgi:hypothetical protein